MQIAFKSVAPRLSLKASMVLLLSDRSEMPEMKVSSGHEVSSYEVQSPVIPRCGRIGLNKLNAD